MKKSYRIVLLILLMLVLVSLVSCNNKSQNDGDNINEPHQEQNTINVSGTDLYSNTFIVESDTMRLTVANKVDSFDFSNTFTIAYGASYTIFDPTMGKHGNVVKLREGDNTFSLNVINGELHRSYQIIIRRKPIYYVRFDDLGDNNVQYVEEGDYAKKPSIEPEKEHYKFEGWDLDFSAPIQNNTTVKAKFVPVIYNIEYILNGAESANNPDTYNIESENILKEPIEGEGLFCGWYIYELGGQFIEAVGGADNIYGDITLYALYDKDVKSIFDIKNGVVLKYEGGSDNGIVKIPEIYNGYLVTEISGDAFNCHNSSNVKNIVLPKGIIKVPSEIFGSCNNLQNVEIDSANKNYKIIDNCLINIKSQKLLKSFNGNSSIPEGIKIIGDYAFRNCLGLSVLNIPYGVIQIGQYAFQNCVNIISVTIPESITKIGNYAFENCYGIYEICNKSALQIQVGDSSNGGVALYAKQIINDESESRIVFDDNYIYYTNTNEKVLLSYKGDEEELLLSVSITKINNYACNNLPKLKLVNIPKSVTDIGFGVFSGCKNIETIRLPFVGKCTEAFGYIFGTSSYDGGVATAQQNDNAQEVYYIPEKLNNVVINSGEIYSGAFTSCNNIKNMELNANYSKGALKGCGGLEKLSLTLSSDYPIGYVFGATDFKGSESVAQSYYYHDYGNKEYIEETYYIPKSLIHVKFKGNSLSGYALANCCYIKSVEISESITNIGSYAFYGCTGLTSITIPDSVTSIGERAFYECTGLTTSITISDSVISVGSSAFFGCKGLTAVYIEDIAKWCAISFGDEYANPLLYAHNLYLNDMLVTDLVIPDSVTSIGSFAFCYCTRLASVMMPDGVKRIGVYAFEYCTGLMGGVTIGRGVNNIGDYAFYGCYKLVEVYNKSSLKITAGSTNNGYIGYYAKNIYTTNNGGSKLSTDENGYIIYTDGEDKILVGYTGTDTELTLPSGITEINYHAFSGCSRLTNITIPDSVTSIGEYAFSGCTGLTSITIPDSVTSIGERAFDSCGLTSVTIGSGVTSIGNYAFSSCNALKAVYITDIAKWCAISFNNSASNPLRYAHNLYLNGTLVTDLVIPDSVTSIGDYAFYGCTGFNHIDILDGVENIGEQAFSHCGYLIVDISISVINIGEKAFYYCESVQIYYEGTQKEWKNMIFGTSWDGYIGDISINYSSRYNEKDSN